MTGLPQGPGKLSTKFCSGNSPNGLMTRPGPGPTSEKLTSELALVPPGLPRCPVLPCPGRYGPSHWCINTQIRSSDYIQRPLKRIHSKTRIILLLLLEMFKAHVEHLVISIFPLLAFPDPPWAKHYKDTPSTVQTSGIFGWLNKHEKQMGQDRNRYVLVLDLTYIY